MVAKTILVSTRKTKDRAEKLKTHIEKLGTVKGSIVKNGDIYEVRARPSSKLIEIYIGSVDEKRFASYIRVIQYGNEGEVI